MLVDFWVQNYRSILEAMTLSAIATSPRRSSADRKPGRYKTDDEIGATYPVAGRDMALLPVLGIFGANASGKSNVLRALTEMLGWIGPYHRPSLEGSLQATPFRLDAASAVFSTGFGIRVARAGSIYEYSLWVLNGRIVHEDLHLTPPAPRRRSLLFSRTHDPSDSAPKWRWGSGFSGPHTQLHSLVRLTQPYLGVLVQQLELEVLEPLQSWLASQSLAVPGDESLHAGLSSWIAAQGEDEFEAMGEILRFADTGITRIELAAADQQEPDRPPLAERFRCYAVREVDGSPVRWPLEEESAGTRRLYGLAWRIFTAIRDGGLLVIDELDASLHPMLVRGIINLFQKHTTNPAGAQLIFSSHDATLHQDQLLRRDQTWFTQKRDDGSTDLYSLSEFKVRNDLDIERAYLDGRFGGVPVLGNLENALARGAVG